MRNKALGVLCLLGCIAMVVLFLGLLANWDWRGMLFTVGATIGVVVFAVALTAVLYAGLRLLGVWK